MVDSQRTVRDCRYAYSASAAVFSFPVPLRKILIHWV